MSSSLRRPRDWACFEIEKLIREVQQRPAIWNKNFDGHTDRRLKSRMWEEVCENLFGNWNNLKAIQKHRISCEVQKKWRNVKDAFNKEVHIEKKLSAGVFTRKKRRYIHYEALSFLAPGGAAPHNAVSLDGSDEESDTASLDLKSIRRSARKKTRIENINEGENITVIKGENFDFEDEASNSERTKQNAELSSDHLLEIEHETSEFADENIAFGHKKFQNVSYPSGHYVEIPCDNWDNEDNNQGAPKKQHESDRFTKPRHGAKVYDEDVSFSDMIVPMLRKLTDDQKHYAKVEIMNVLHKAKRYHSDWSCQTQADVVRTEATDSII